MRIFLLSGGFSFHQKDYEPSTEVYEVMEVIEQQLQNMSQDTKIIVLCAGDAVYKDQGSKIIERIQNMYPNIKIILSGNPSKVGIEATSYSLHSMEGAIKSDTLRTILGAVMGF